MAADAADDLLADPLEALVTQTRTRREALHLLVDRMRTEHPLWERDALELTRRARLTPTQREYFRAHLAARPPRRR